MNNYIIWNGKDSRNIKGLIICELPPITVPNMRVAETVIDGVDGSLFEELGYASYDKVLSIGLTQNADMGEISQYFNGNGDIVFSNEPNRVYKARIIGQIDFARLVRFRTATVTFRVQPFKYALTDDYVQCVQTKQVQGNDLYITDSKLVAFEVANTSDTDISADIVRIGKNLFSGFIKGERLNSSDGTIDASDNSARSGDISVDFSVNANYHLSGLPSSLWTFVAFYNAGGEFLGRTGANPVEKLLINTNSILAGTPQGTGDIAFIRVTSYVNGDGNIDDIDSANVQLEIGTQATEYVPYNNDMVQLTFGAGEKITLTNEELLKIQTEDGTNHIFVESEKLNMSATYCASKTQVTNRGNTTAKPKLTIRGFGTIKVKVGETIFEYTFPNGENFVAVDSELQDAYVSVGLRNRQMLGNFPVLDAGENTITWEGLITFFSIEKISRWL